MAHWGWYWWVKQEHIAKKLCSELPKIDSFQLFKEHGKAFIIQPLDIKAELKDNKLIVTYRKQRSASYQINIETLSCNYGGHRYYFKCPLCHKRMRFLYLESRSVILCRKCLNLGYKSQRLRPSLRYSSKKDSISKLVNNKGGSISENKRPHYMRKQKFEHLKNLALYYKQKAGRATNMEIRKWFGTRAEPYIDEYFDYVDENLKS